jgi:hypothetical protein
MSLKASKQRAYHFLTGWRTLSLTIFCRISAALSKMREMMRVSRTEVRSTTQTSRTTTKNPLERLPRPQVHKRHLRRQVQQHQDKDVPWRVQLRWIFRLSRKRPGPLRRQVHRLRPHRKQLQVRELGTAQFIPSILPGAERTVHKLGPAIGAIPITGVLSILGDLFLISGDMTY